MMYPSVTRHLLLFGEKRVCNACGFSLCFLNNKINNYNNSLMSFNLVFSRLKHFSPFHKQDRKVFIFTNTDRNLLKIPHGMKMCLSLDSFQTKFSRQDFKRCTQEIEQLGVFKATNFHSSHIDSVEPIMRNIQLELTTMAIEFLENMPLTSSLLLQSKKEAKNGLVCLNHGKLALDVGCGRGICIHPLVDRGYTCIGVDLNLHSLSKFKSDKNSAIWINHSSALHTEKKSMFSTPPADVVRFDLRHGLPFRNDTFDVAISISFLQWLFHGNRDHQLDLFFYSLYKSLCNNGTAVIQFYPRSKSQLFDAVSYAMVYFKGALIGDYPHLNRGRKLFLLLQKV